MAIVDVEAHRGHYARHLGLDTLSYLSLEGLLSSTGIDNPKDHFCKACFDGCYPVQFDKDLSRYCMDH